MTRKFPETPDPRAAALPAKDLLRGARAMARAAGAALEPLERELPDPLRRVARGAAAGLESAAARVRLAARGLAARILPGADGGDHLLSHELDAIMGAEGAAALFADAAAHGLDFTLHRRGRDDLMVSETLAAFAYRAARGAGGDRFETGARLHLALLERHAVGRAPGTSLGLSAEDLAEARHAGFAVTLWMLVERDAPREDEDELLALCADLTEARRAEIDAAGEDPTALAALFAASAELI